jgi:hypothetical protein
MTVPVAGSLLAIPVSVWIAAIIDVALKGTVLIVAASLLCRWLAGQPASARSRVWTITFVLLGALPLVQVAVPAQQRVLDSDWMARVVSAMQVVTIAQAPDVVMSPLPASSGDRSASRPSPVDGMRADRGEIRSASPVAGAPGASAGIWPHWSLCVVLARLARAIGVLPDRYGIQVR